MRDAKPPVSSRERAEAAGGDVATTTTADIPPARGRRREESIGSFLRELPVLVLVAFLLAFLLRTFVVQVFYIPSSSMEPTLQINDRILVDKVTYRFRDLRRGEIVVFEGEQRDPPDVERGPVARVVHGLGQLVGLAPANARDYVKRVIGLPGDEIRIDDGAVSVNGVELPEPYVSVPDVGDCGPLVVPEDSLFFLGDNRPNSSDSRPAGGLGFVHRDRVVGRAFVVIWPLDHITLLGSPDYPPVPAGDHAPPPRPADPSPIEGLCEPAA